MGPSLNRLLRDVEILLLTNRVAKKLVGVYPLSGIRVGVGSGYVRLIPLRLLVGIKLYSGLNLLVMVVRRMIEKMQAVRKCR